MADHTRIGPIDFIPVPFVVIERENGKEKTVAWLITEEATTKNKRHNLISWAGADVICALTSMILAIDPLSNFTELGAERLLLHEEFAIRRNWGRAATMMGKGG